MKVLLAHQAQAKLGPIICVCYTNHALGQFLEHPIADGTTNVIRIGSQSKSAIVEPLNLRFAAQKMARTKTEKQQEWTLRNDLEANSEAVQGLFRQISHADSQSAVWNIFRLTMSIISKILLIWKTLKVSRWLAEAETISRSG